MSFQDLVKEHQEPQINIPKSWQDALAQLFQQAPQDSDLDMTKRKAFDLQSSARLIEKSRQYARH